MATAMNRPETVEESFERGSQSHHEGMNPFRNTGIEDYELHNAWVDGFNSRESDVK